jgi:protein TonB
MFDEALIESFPRRSWKVRPVLASASVHAVALGTIVWISVQAIGEIGEPPETTIYRVAFNPPPLGDGGNGTIRKLATLPRSLPRSEQFQPAQVTDTKLREADLQDTFDLPDPEQGNERGNNGRLGDHNGVDGGTGDKPVKEIGSQEITYDIPNTPGLVPPVLVTRVEPVYPETARKAHLSGVVVLQAVIDASGRVKDLRVVKSSGELLDAAAIAAVEKWIYRPATLSGRAVNVSLSVTVDFKLH